MAWSHQALPGIPSFMRLAAAPFGDPKKLRGAASRDSHSGEGVLPLALDLALEFFCSFSTLCGAGDLGELVYVFLREREGRERAFGVFSSHDVTQPSSRPGC